MDTSDQINLPYLASNQAQKHVTLNAALQIIDQLAQLAVLDRVRTQPPGEPLAGDRYIIASPATGAWAGHEDAVAVFTDGAWAFHTPKAGWRAYDLSAPAALVFDGSAWIADTPQRLERLGVATAPDASNPLAVRLNGGYFTAVSAGDGGNGDLRLSLNKETTANVLSLLFQTGWQARAELGLVGSDSLSLRTVTGAGAFLDALTLDQETAEAELHAGLHTPHLNAGALAGHRNRVLNGCFRIWARGDNFSLSSPAYTADRFRVEPAGSVTVTRQTDLHTEAGAPAGLANALEIASASDGHVLETRLEGAEHFAGQICTLSAYIWLPSAGTPGAELYRHLDTAGDAGLTISPASSGDNSGSGWRQCQWTFSPPALPALTMGADAYLSVRLTGLPGGARIGRIQLEPGRHITPFEYRPRAVEGDLCRRYFERFGGEHAYGSFGLAASEGTALARFVLTYAEKRTGPTISASGTFRLRRSGEASTVTITNWFSPGRQSARADMSSSSLTPGGAYEFSALADASAHIDVDAEL